MLTMNYQDLQYRYSKQKKKKQSQLKDEKYQLTKGNFSASTWKDYKDWIKEQKLKEKPSKPKKKKKGIITKAKGQKAVKGLEKALTRKEQYYQELKDKRWKDKSLQIMKRDGFKCALCGSKHNLQVHHTRYENGKKAWEYSDSTLVVLCKDCHEEVHRDYKHYLHPKYEEIWYNIDIKGLEDYEATRFGRIRHKDTKKRIQWNHLGMWSDDNDTQKILVNGKWVSKSEVLEKLY